MSMNAYPNHGHVIEVTAENIRKLNLGQAGEDFIKLIDEVGLDEIQDSIEYGDAALGGDFFQAFQDKYNLCPELYHTPDDADGCDGVEPCAFYFLFSDGDKYIQTVRPEWEALPIAPEDASWCIYG